MPIGFWAVSRNEVKEIWESLAEQTPHIKVKTPRTQVLDIICRALPDILDRETERIIREHMVLENQLR